LYLKQSQAFDMLEARGIATIKSPLTDDAHPIPDDTPASSKEHLLSVSIDRTARSPCIIASPSTNPADMFQLAEKFPFAYGSDGATSDAMLENVSKHLGMEGVAEKLTLSLEEESSAAEKIRMAAKPILEKSASEPEKPEKPKSGKEKYSTKKSVEDEKKAAPNLKKRSA